MWVEGGKRRCMFGRVHCHAFRARPLPLSDDPGHPCAADLDCSNQLQGRGFICCRDWPTKGEWGGVGGAGLCRIPRLSSHAAV